MKKTVFTVLKKELARFFGDKRLAFVTILMPGLLIYVLYSLMGLFLASTATSPSDYEYKIFAVNMPTSIATEFSAVNLEWEEALLEDVEGIKKDVKAEKSDLLVVFPENFDKIIENKQEIPNVSVYYNSAAVESSEAFGAVSELLDRYETKLNNLFDVNLGGEKYDLADEKDIIGTLFASLLPMLLMIMLFTGAVAVTPESIAGEKERGTMASLLVTPAKRSGIAFGKIIALSIIALLSGLSSTLGVLLSMGNLTGGLISTGGTGYGFFDYAALALVILSTVLLIVAVLSIISAFAKNVKEASSWSSPLMFVLMGLSLTTMLEIEGGGVVPYLIPFYNSITCMANVFAFSLIPLNFIVTIAVNLVCTGLCVVVLSKMFDSEKVIFGK